MGALLSNSLAVVVTHPIPHFSPWFREITAMGQLRLRVLFCCDWGSSEYRDSEFNKSFEWDIPLLEGFDFEFLSVRRRPERLTFWEVDNPDVGSALERFGPDVVQGFGYAHRTMWRVWNWARRRQKPFLLYSDSTLTERPALWKRPLKKAVVQSFYRHVDGALSVGDNNAAYHRSYGVPADRIFPGVLPIDRRRLLESVSDRVEARRRVRKTYGIPQDAFVVLFCGKLTPRKRPYDVMEACHGVAQQGFPAWSLIVGDGPERQRLENAIGSGDVSNAVLSGFVNQTSIGEYYATADAMAVTSERDPHPLVVTEAAAFGLPVVISDRVGCIGSRDTAQPGVNALVYECGVQSSLQGCIRRLGQDRELYDELSKHASSVAEEQDAPMAARALFGAVRTLEALGPR